MKKLWWRIMKQWQLFWKDDAEDASVRHLSQSDKRELWYGAIISCLFTVAICCFVIAFNNRRIRRQNDEGIEELAGMIAAYMESATEDEYEAMAQTIRHDLIFSKYGQEIEDYIRYIPNTSESCRICESDDLSQVYIVSANTGEIYTLDLFEPGASSNDIRQNGTNLSFGYDEISETSLFITKNLRKKEATVTVQRGRGIISIQRMKTLFCDECIDEMLKVVEKQRVEELIICSAEKKEFYAIEEGKIFIGDYEMQVEYRDGNYEIEIQYIK